MLPETTFGLLSSIREQPWRKICVTVNPPQMKTADHPTNPLLAQVILQKAEYLSVKALEIHEKDLRHAALVSLKCHSLQTWERKCRCQSFHPCISLSILLHAYMDGLIRDLLLLRVQLWRFLPRKGADESIIGHESRTRETKVSSPRRSLHNHSTLVISPLLQDASSKRQ